MGMVTRLFRLHRKWLTVIGGVTLFLTFLVKEGFREQAKDQLSAIDKAQSEFKQSNNHRDEMLAIYAGPAPLGSVRGQAPINTQGQAFTVATEYSTGASVNEFSDTEDLEASMPANEDLAKKREAVKIETQKMADLMSKFQETISVERQSQPTTPEQKKLVGDMSDQSAEVQNALTAYRDATLETAQARHEKLQVRYERFTVASYFLFTFGLLVSVFGKLLEPSSEPPEIE